MRVCNVRSGEACVLAPNLLIGLAPPWNTGVLPAVCAHARVSVYMLHTYRERKNSTLTRAHLHRERPIDSNEVVDPLGGREAGLPLLVVAEKHAPFHPGIPLGTCVAHSTQAGAGDGSWRKR